MDREIMNAKRGLSMGDHELIEDAARYYDELSKWQNKAIEEMEVLEPETVKSKAKERKETPVFSGVLNYFPDAIREVAKASKAGNDQHNPNTPLHWDRSKSGDELDALSRHLLEAGTIDDDGIRHSTKVAWRALANLQKEIEKDIS